MILKLFHFKYYFNCQNSVSIIKKYIKLTTRCLFMTNKKEKKQPDIIDVDVEKKKKERKQKILDYLKDLSFSTFKTKHAFRFACRHWITPLLLLTISLANT